MKFEQLFKTERFADILISSLKRDKNILASKEKTDKGILVSYDAKAYSDSIEKKEEDASVHEIVNEAVSYLYGEMQYMAQFVFAEMDSLWEWAAKHSDGHLPNVSSVEQMTRAVDNLGLSSEYEVVKKTIWASKDGTTLDSIEADVTR